MNQLHSQRRAERRAVAEPARTPGADQPTCPSDEGQS